MKTLYLSIFIKFFLFSNYCFSQAPNWLWAKRAGGSVQDIAFALKVDTSGNSYIAGSFSSAAITFGSTTLTNVSSSAYDIFLTKYDASGNVLWAKSAGGMGADVINSIDIDMSGNVYVAGYFSGVSITFGSTTLTSVGNADIFLAKYDVLGNFLWAKSAGGTSLDWGISLVVDAFGDAYITGRFQSATISFGSTILTNVGAGSSDIFLVKYNPAGNVLWAKSTGGTNNEEPYSIALDNSRNIYVGGLFTSASISFGFTTITNAGSADIFLAKYDSSGTALWARSIGGTGGDRANSLVIDSNGNIYQCGSFYSPILNFGSIVLNNYDSNGNSSDIFLTKYDSTGYPIWASSSGGLGFDEATALALDILGNIYVTGSFSSDTIYFGSSPVVNSATNTDIFLVKYDSTGNVPWAIGAGGSTGEQGNSVDVDASGNVYIAGGFYSSNVSFGFTSLNNANSNGSLSDIFLAKLGIATVINELNNDLFFSVFPNPSVGIFQLNFGNIQFTGGELEIYDILGEIVFSSTNVNPSMTLDLSNLTNGIYFIILKTEKEEFAQKILINK